MNRGEFIFSTSLKLLLQNTEMKRELNYSATRDFLFHKYIIPNESTLIDNIHKVVPGEFIVVDIEKRLLSRGCIKRKSTRVTRKMAEDNMITSVANSITQLEGRLSNRQDIVTTLSSGYDTNIILSILRKACNANIKAITIGGREHNEIPAAKKSFRIAMTMCHTSRKQLKKALWFVSLIWCGESKDMYIHQHYFSNMN